MKFCQPHWDKLSEAIKARGLWHLVARSGQEATSRMKQELAGTETDATYDPLMSCHWKIFCRALQLGGLYLVQADLCPVCEALVRTPLKPDGDPAKEFRSKEELEAYWIDGPADSELAYAKEKGIVPTPGVPEVSGG
jgi:hypothetical protein